MKKYIVIFLLTVGCISALVFVSINRQKGERPFVVGGLFATYKYIDRDVSLSYFYELDGTNTYQQILDEIGEPNGYRGSGIACPYYQVDDLYVVIVFARGEDGGHDKVVMIYLYSNDEFIEKVYPR